MKSPIRPTRFDYCSKPELDRIRYWFLAIAKSHDDAFASCSMEMMFASGVGGACPAGTERLVEMMQTFAELAPGRVREMQHVFLQDSFGTENTRGLLPRTSRRERAGHVNASGSPTRQRVPTGALRKSRHLRCRTLKPIITSDYVAAGRTRDNGVAAIMAYLPFSPALAFHLAARQMLCHMR